MQPNDAHTRAHIYSDIHTRRSYVYVYVCARVRGTTRPAGPAACYISENRNGPTAGRPLSLSLISMCRSFSSLSLYFALLLAIFHPSPSLLSSDDGIRPCIILLIHNIYIHIYYCRVYTSLYTRRIVYDDDGLPRDSVV